MRLLNFSTLKPHKFFITFASSFGLIILLLTPPFQVPDEIIHFYKAYQISEGNFISIKQNDRIGGFLPTSIIKITGPFLGLRWYNHTKTNRKIIFEQFKVPLKDNERTFADFPNNAMYSPVCYIPQALSIFVFRKLNLPPLYIFYGARLFTLLFWIFGIYKAIKIIPFYKWLFALIALLPMSLYINMSLSADVMTNLLSFFFIAYTLKYAYSKTNVTYNNFLILLLLIILLASTKLVYTPLVLLIFLIPKKNFMDKKHYFIQISLVFIIAFCTVIFWSIKLNNLYLPYNLYNRQFRDAASLIECVNAYAQMEYLTNHNIYIIRVLINSMVQSFDMYFRGYIGTFGWLDTLLPIRFIYLAYSVLFGIALIEKSNTIIINLKQKIIIAISIIITISLVLLSQHLSWNCVGGEIIVTIQGRYFIPVFPLLFILFYNTKFNYTKLVKPLVIIFTIISLSITVKTIYSRYYVLSESKSAIIN